MATQNWIERAIQQHRNDTKDLPKRILNIYASKQQREEDENAENMENENRT